MSGHSTATPRGGLAAGPYHWLENLPRVGCCEVPDAHLLEWGGKFLLYRPAAGVVELTPDRPVADIGTTRFPGFDPTPLSLTLAVHRQCGLCCSYCYGVPDKHRTTSSLSREAVAWAAASVARNCRSRRLPLQVNFHGDNEPLSRPELLKGYIETVRKVADEAAVDLRLACTTGGLVPIKTAHWAARNFDSLTISHDGPSPLHDMQRPTCSGKPSSREVERTLSIFCSENRRGELTIRSTITRHNETRQSAMVDYFLDHFAVDRLAFYPVYHSPHRNGDRGLAVEAETFVRHFLAARQRARTKEVDLEYAGSRAPQRHGRHCTLLQRNLMLTPDGDASVCFMALDSRRHWDRQRLFGGRNASGEYPLLNQQEACSLLEQLGGIGPQCRNCFNLWHCEQGCPESCPLDRTEGSSFDCRIPFWIGISDILESADMGLRQGEYLRLFSLLPATLDFPAAGGR